MSMSGEVLTDTDVRRERMKRAVKRIPREERVPLPENASTQDKKALPAVIEGSKLIDPKDETFAERQARLVGKREKYASMKAHQELAAVVLAAGGTFKMAAAKAGISVRQAKKYYTDPDFRARIEEMRQIMFSKVRGRVIKELEKRTEPGKIDRIELLDLLRVFDRVAGPIGGKAGVNIAGDVNVTNTQYDTIIASLLAPQSAGESPDFPSFELDSIRLPSGDSPE